MGMMDVKACNNNFNNNVQSSTTDQEDMEGLRRGPWTVEEDLTLMNYIAKNGEGRWNSLARCAGLRRTGKSCRLRWLNYLRPDVKRGNITLEEQLLILELHSRWGNRWSKIAQELPGRTDNEIKNYWRTRVQKHAKQLKCDVNSKQFKDTMRYLWMPRLVERIQAAAAAAAAASASGTSTTTSVAPLPMRQPQLSISDYTNTQVMTPNYASENSSTAASSDSIGTQISNVSDLAEYYPMQQVNSNPNQEYFHAGQMGFGDNMNSPAGFMLNHGLDMPSMEQNNISWMDSGEALNSFWNVDDYLFSPQFNSNM